MLGLLDMVIENLHHISLLGDIFIDIRINHLSGGLSLINSLLHDTRADSRHLRTVIRIDDGRDNVATESGTDLVKKILVGLSGLRVGVRTDLKLGTVGGEAAGQRGRYPRTEVATDHGSAHEANLRLLPLEKLHKDVSVRSGSVREQTFSVKNKELVHTVRKDLILDLTLDSGTGDHSMKLDTELIGELTAFGEQLLGDLHNGCPLYLAIYKYVVHGTIRLSSHPTIP